jgi:hypothetical protein
MEQPRDNASIWNRLRIAGEALPGIVQSVRLGGALKMDRETVSGQSGVVITDANWSEDSATFELLVLAAELKRFAEFRSKYKNSAGEKPIPVVVDHPLLKAFGIQKMLISAIEINWNNTQKDRVPVSVSLTNINPKTTKTGATNPDGTVKPTNPPTPIKPGASGVAPSNAITGQPTPAAPKPPTIPPAGR